MQAGVFEPPPADEDALADTMGLMLNCINSGLYMANYNVVIPTVRIPTVSICWHTGHAELSVHAGHVPV